MTWLAIPICLDKQKFQKIENKNGMKLIKLQVFLVYLFCLGI